MLFINYNILLIKEHIMVDKEDLLKQAENIHSGLKRLSLKNRKVVMPHHKEFELIEEMEELSIDLIEKLKE
jgi:hypothetical protein